MTASTVMIVGAGPTGLTLACALRGFGVSVRIVDRAQQPANTSRALGLQPRGVEVLDRIGALGDLPERSLRVNDVIVTVSGRELTRLHVGQRTRLGGHAALLLGQAEIEGALRARLAELGGAVEWGRGVTAVHQGEALAVHLADGAVEHASWVVGSDGAHSVVRKAAGIGFPGVPLMERFLIADVHADLDRPRDAVSVWLRGADMLAAFPLPGADLWRLMTPAPTGFGHDPDRAEVLARLRERVEVETGKPGQVQTADWTSSFQIHRRLADTYRRGRILLAGDAAHVHSPLGGQGMNTGIGDAENLAWKLALVVEGRATPDLLDTYEAERRPVAREVLAGTSRMTELMFGEAPAARFLRDHLVVPLMNRPLVQREITERSSQLLVSYRRGPLATREPGLGALRRVLVLPRPGDRVRDLPCRRADGSLTRLHVELGGRWALLDGDWSGALAVARAWLGDQVVPLLPVSEGRDEALLVRPDGHLAWRGRDPATLQAWLSRALGQQVAPTAGRACADDNTATPRLQG